MAEPSFYAQVSRLLMAAAAGAAAFTIGGSAHAQTPDFAPCIQWAALNYGVNADALTAIFRVESRMRPDTIVANTNGTYDLGLGGINTIHLPELARHGIGAANLLDACTNINVTAWMVARNLQKYGNTWKAYAVHHSKTPSVNERYQLLLARELVAMGVVR